MITLNYKRVSNGKNVWFVDGRVTADGFLLDQVHGDINDARGIWDAVNTLLESKLKYQRALGNTARLAELEMNRGPDEDDAERHELAGVIGKLRN